LDLFAALPATRPTSRPALVGSAATAAATGPERVLAAELQARGSSSDALSMMVSSMLRMVQVGQQRDSRWHAS